MNWLSVYWQPGSRAMNCSAVGARDRISGCQFTCGQAGIGLMLAARSLVPACTIGRKLAASSLVASKGFVLPASFQQD